MAMWNKAGVMKSGRPCKCIEDDSGGTCNRGRAVSKKKGTIVLGLKVSRFLKLEILPFLPKPAPSDASGWVLIVYIKSSA